MKWRIFLMGHSSDGGGGSGVGDNSQMNLSQESYDKKISENAENLPSANPAEGTNQNPAPGLEEGKDYNIGGKIPSNVIKYPVTSGEGNVAVHKRPKTGESNSVYRILDHQGNLLAERYFDGDGKPYLDIDYTDHGKSRSHSSPHYHEITIDKDGHIQRGPQKNV